MDQTVDILGLCDDQVGFNKNEDVETQPNSLLESNLVYEASKKETGINGFNSKLPEDKKPLVYDTRKPNSSLLSMPQTNMEYLRLLGIVAGVIISIVLLYVIFDTKSKGIYPCKFLF